MRRDPRLCSVPLERHDREQGTQCLSVSVFPRFHQLMKAVDDTELDYADGTKER